MNKLTKGSLATGAGLVLLLGGTGTFMSWNDEEAIAGGAVTAGHLDVTAGASAWTVNGVAVPNIAAYPIVPGDTVVYTTDLEVTAEGENLTASLGLTEGALAPATDGAADVALATELGADAELALTSTNGLATANGGNSYTLDAGTTAVTETLTATVTLQFPYADDASVDENAMDGSVNLSEMNVSLTQTANPAPAAA